MKIAAVLAYFCVLLFLGWWASRKTRDMRDYFAGGKRMGFLSVAFSARATGESAWLLLGLTGFGAAFGLKGLWIVAGELLGVALAWLWMARRFKRLTDRYDSITIPDYLESRFRDSGHMIRLIAAGALLVFVPIYVSAQIHATGTAFNDFLGWNYFVGAAVGFGIVLLYITTGGFIAVVWSDVFQGTLMLLGLVALPIVGLWVAGGLDPVLATLRADYPGHLTLHGGTGWTALTIASVVGLLGIGFCFMGSPQVFVRLLPLRSESEIGKGAAVALVWTVLADTGAVMTGVVGRALIEGDLGTDSESVLPMMVEQFLPVLVGGFFIAVVLSAIMSTIDSLLVVASSAAVRDCYQKYLHPELSDEGLVRLARILTLVLALVAFLIAMAIAVLNGRQPIFWFVIFGWSGIAATFCPTIILSLFWRGFTARGAKLAMIAGFACVPVFKFGISRIPGIGEYIVALDVLAPSFAVSMLVGILASLTDPKRGELTAEAGGDLDWSAGRKKQS